MTEPVSPDLMSDLRSARDGLVDLSETDLGAYGAELASLEDAAEVVGRSWSGSNLGYQANVYYKGLQRPPSGAFFSREWGFLGVFQGTVGDWVEQDRGEIRAEIYAMAGNVDTKPITGFAGEAAKSFRMLKDRAVSSLTVLLGNREDEYLQELLAELRDVFLPSVEQLIKSQMRAETAAVRDMRALEGGWQSAAHQDVLGVVWAARLPFKMAAEAAVLLGQVVEHLERSQQVDIPPLGQLQQAGDKVFIGHGRSLQWLVLKDFLQDTLGLTCDEFNREPVAGITNVERLETMLGEASIAFLVLTAEDEQSNGEFHARQNVVHEAGLFQGRLGFRRAIVMLEDGAVEWSNINGLGQIRFPPGDIAARFEDVRRVLERERLITTATAAPGSLGPE